MRPPRCYEIVVTYPDTYVERQTRPTQEQAEQLAESIRRRKPEVEVEVLPVTR